MRHFLNARELVSQGVGIHGMEYEEDLVFALWVDAYQMVDGRRDPQHPSQHDDNDGGGSGTPAFGLA